MLIDDGLELLTERQCEEFLGSATFGRIGVTIGGLPVILPVNYAYIDRSVLFRTRDGAKLRAANRGTVVAFEIDDFDRVTASGWSVLVIGRASEIVEGSEFSDLIDASIVPSALGDRDHLVRIASELITGRRLAG